MNMSGYGSITKVDPQSRREGWRFESVSPPRSGAREVEFFLKDAIPQGERPGQPQGSAIVEVMSSNVNVRRRQRSAY